MASRNERKRLAKARHAELKLAVKEAFSLESAKQTEKSARQEALIAVNHWTRKGTHCICYPGIDKVV
jgi:hypothetical protein